MQALFSGKGQARLDDVVQPGILCAFDFDGTLAPITSHPEGARLPRDVLERLLHLSSLTPIAVLTGRSLSDIRARLGFDPPYVVGNHGVEGMADAADLARHEACCRAWRAQIDAALGKQQQLQANNQTGMQAGIQAGIHLEDKRYSLSLHYRAAPDHAAAAARLQGLIARLEPAPRVVAGKCVFNLLPPDSFDKGGALLQLLRRSGAAGAIYVGDDVTDEDVFRMRSDEVLSVRVEYAAGSAAEFYIPEHADIARLLDELIRRLARMQAGKAAQLAGPERA
ncbi:MAG TPA: trehalose-phosphatase [Oxalobacteraceae bacterium]|nr:trehalose-phosphatase [Oxalobacteraceae bacterium]